MIFRLAFMALLLASIPSSGFAEPPVSADHDRRLALAAELGELNEVLRSVEGWKSQLLTQDPSAGVDCDSQVSERLKRGWQEAVETGFDTRRIAEHIKSSIAARHTARELEEAIVFAKSDLGRTLTAATVARVMTDQGSSSAEEQQQREMMRLDAAARSLESNPTRARLIAEIIETTDALNGQIAALMSMSRGTAMGAAVITKDQPQLWGDELESMLETQQAMMRELFEPLMPAMYEDLYAAVSTEELRAYVVWLKTPTGRKVALGGTSAFLEAVSAAAEKIGADFARNMRSERI